MTNLSEKSLKAKNYKCFGNEEQGFDEILPINVVVGRNNSGKSALLDVVEYATSPRNVRQHGHGGFEPEIFLSSLLTEDDIKKGFSETAHGGGLPGGRSHFVFARKWIDGRIEWQLKEGNATAFHSIEPPLDFPDDVVTKCRNMFLRCVTNPFIQYDFKRLLAERDIVPEIQGDEPAVSPNGTGSTNAINLFINSDALPSELVEKKILDQLNIIFEPDGQFTRIVIQRNDFDQWELYLEESKKGRVALAHTGSGLKTIILVLLNLYLIPQIEKKKLNNYIFGFEELENNMHPALLRRLLLYLRKMALEHDCFFFLTTHSNVTIDTFANDKDAQILHVTHTGSEATVSTVKTYIDNHGILDDLDVRSSDLLQSNGIVWVEGPSDRLYFNKWIEVWTDGLLKEGTHYQCVFYGGRLLAHLSADDPTLESEAIKIFRVNRNAIVLIDSDRKTKGQRINKTKQRIRKEIDGMGGMEWVTHGKEIENYIPEDCFKLYYGTKYKRTRSLGKYNNISTYLISIDSSEGKRFLKNKVLFAERFSKYFTKVNLSTNPELSTSIEEAVKNIKSWNRIS